MTSIAFFNNKGGVGKTTLLCNLAGYLSIGLGKKILVIDADPQSNATAYLLGDEQLNDIYEDDGKVNLYAYFDTVARGQGYADTTPHVVRSTRFAVDVLPGHPRFALREDLLAKDWGDTQIGSERGLQTTYTFHHLLAGLAPKYDIVLVDMGPSLGAINRSILLAADFFVTPMSADLFSLMAVENIILSLASWREDLDAGLNAYARKTKIPYKQDGVDIAWKVRFLGFVTQQYKMQTIRGEARAVKSYDRIIQRFPKEIGRLEAQFGLGDMSSADLGQFPSLFSLVPMSQTAHAPIFSLGSSDGVVGAHFAKVDESRAMFTVIAERLTQRLQKYGELK